MDETVVVNGNLSVHDLGEGAAIAVAVSELQACRRTVGIDRLVVREAIELLSQRVVPAGFHRGARCVHEQLQRREPLLTIDDAVRSQAREDRLLGLDDDRAEEVRRLGEGLVEPDRGEPSHVLPQGCPLLVLLPDVWALEGRHHQVLGLDEDSLRRVDVGLHDATSSWPRYRLTVNPGDRRRSSTTIRTSSGWFRTRLSGGRFESELWLRV